MIVDTSLPETHMRELLIKISKKCIFLCDSTKFSLFAPYNLAPLKNVDIIVTDEQIPEHFLKLKNKIIVAK